MTKFCLSDGVLHSRVRSVLTMPSHLLTFRVMSADIGPHAKTYKRFKFASCQPSRAATTVDTADEIQAGRVDVNIKEVVSTGQRKRHTPGGVERPSADVDSKKLPEGKKWFMAPGLKVGAQLVKGESILPCDRARQLQGMCGHLTSLETRECW